MATATNPILPLFAAAPRVSISMAGNVIAHAIGINFNLAVDVEPIFVFGEYGPVALEPKFYNPVTGTIQIIRLANNANRSATAANAFTNTGTMTKTLDLGLNESRAAIKHVKTYGAATDPDSSEKSTTANAILSKGGLGNHLDPGKVLVSALFDMTISLRVPTEAVLGSINGQENQKEPVDPVSGYSDSKTGPVTLTKYIDWIQIKGCRLTASNTNITMGQIVNEPVSFTGLLVVPNGVNISLDSSIADS